MNVSSTDSEPVPGTSSRASKILPRLALAGCVVLFAVVFVRTAWVSDDAYITFRVVHNCLRGFGLRYNVADRVQAFTHPFWTLCLIPLHALTGEPYFSTVFLSMFFATLAVALVFFGVAKTYGGAAFAAVALFGSRAFVDFSSSGLENPLSHALLALFAFLYFREGFAPGQFLCLSLIAALGLTNRMDTLLLYAPMLAYAASRSRTWRVLPALAIGMAPFLAWELFSLLYYGYLVPNTAPAKLGGGIPLREMAAMGLHYFAESFRTDPTTLLLCAAGVAWPLAARRWKEACAGAGIVFYLLYVVRIGGDFMDGRFFAEPFLCGVMVLAQARPKTPWRWWAPVGAAAGVLACVAPYPSILTGRDYTMSPEERNTDFNDGCFNARRAYYIGSGLLRAWPIDPSIGHISQVVPGADSVKDAQLIVAAGLEPYAAGPGVHFIDLYCLVDPLRARLPRVEGTGWRPGHVFRAFPKGYMATLATGRNQMDDKRLAAYYDRVALIARGPLFSFERLKTILLMNLGGYGHLIDVEGYRHPAKPGATRDPAGRPLQEDFLGMRRYRASVRSTLLQQ